MDLRISDRGRGYRLPDAQLWMEIGVLHYRARRLPWIRDHQPHRPPPPGESVGHWLRRDLLSQQCPHCQSPHEIPAAGCLPQCHIYPFTSAFLPVCFLLALSLFSGHFIVQTLNVTFLIYLMTISLILIGLTILEVRCSGAGLEEWWCNEQFWLISGTSDHLYAVVQGHLKVMADIKISFTLSSKSTAEDNDDIFADLYLIK